MTAHLVPFLLACAADKGTPTRGYLLSALMLIVAATEYSQNSAHSAAVRGAIQGSHTWIASLEADGADAELVERSRQVLLDVIDTSGRFSELHDDDTLHELAGDLEASSALNIVAEE